MTESAPPVLKDAYIVLNHTIDRANNEMVKARRLLDDEMSKRIRGADEERNQGGQAARKDRDQKKATAEATYRDALRKAQGDRDRAVVAADTDCEKTFAGIRQTFSTACAPVEAWYLEALQAVLDTQKKIAEDAKAAFEKVEKAVEAANRKSKASIGKPAEPAPADKPAA